MALVGVEPSDNAQHAGAGGDVVLGPQALASGGISGGEEPVGDSVRDVVPIGQAGRVEACLGRRDDRRSPPKRRRHARCRLGTGSGRHRRNKHHNGI
mgnify:CR=1 FL=1